MALYEITIAGVSGAAPTDGFIDPKTVYQYMEASASDLPTNYANSLAKSRANRRHRSIIGIIQFYSGMIIQSVVVGGTPNASTAPTSIKYSVIVGDINTVTVKDENNPGTVLTGVAAVKRIIARALVKSETILLDIYDPTKSSAPGNTTAWARAGTRFNIETVGGLYANVTAAEAGITVTLVP